MLPVQARLHPQLLRSWIVLLWHIRVLFLVFGARVLVELITSSGDVGQLLVAGYGCRLSRADAP